MLDLLYTNHFIKYIVLVFLYVTFYSCGMKTVYLGNKITKVPIDDNAFGNKNKFDLSLFDNIDTSVIYEEYNTTFFIGSKPIDVLALYNYQNPDKFYEAYKFYNNGCFNLFILNRDDTISKETFNPNFNGYRGVFYRDNGIIKADLFTRTTGIGKMAIITEKLKFIGDTLFVKERIDTKVYIKRKLPLEYFDYKADW